MSSRHDESIGRMPNPCEYFLEWNSELSSFAYYSANDQKRLPFPLPFRFLALKFMNSVQGYDKHRQQGVYSNEVTDTRMEHFRVSYRDGSTLATGLYSDIKDDIKAAGGHFTRSIYAMTPKGTVVNIALRGGQMVNFGAIEKFGNRWRDEWIQVSEFQEKVYDDKPYSLPVFSFGGTLATPDLRKADNAYKLVRTYFDSKSSRPTEHRPAQARPSQPAAMAPAPSGLFAPDGDDDDLPF